MKKFSENEIAKLNGVELIPAHVWDCPDCGAENFARCITMEFDDAEAAEMRLMHGIDVLQEGMFLTMPPVVTCNACKNQYRSIPFACEDE